MEREVRVNKAVIELYGAMPSHQLVYLIKDCKELLAAGCPREADVRYTLKALRNIMIERQVR